MVICCINLGCCLCTVNIFHHVFLILYRHHKPAASQTLLCSWFIECVSSSDNKHCNEQSVTIDCLDTNKHFVCIFVNKEEERSRFQVSSRMNARPSCVAHEITRRRMSSDLKLGNSVLGQV